MRIMSVYSLTLLGSDSFHPKNCGVYVRSNFVNIVVFVSAGSVGGSSSDWCWSELQRRYHRWSESAWLSWSIDCTLWMIDLPAQPTTIHPSSSSEPTTLRAAAVLSRNSRVTSISTFTEAASWAHLGWVIIEICSKGGRAAGISGDRKIVWKYSRQQVFAVWWLSVKSACRRFKQLDWW